MKLVNAECDRGAGRFSTKKRAGKESRDRRRRGSRGCVSSNVEVAACTVARRRLFTLWLQLVSLHRLSRYSRAHRWVPSSIVLSVRADGLCSALRSTRDQLLKLLALCRRDEVVSLRLMRVGKPSAQVILNQCLDVWHSILTVQVVCKEQSSRWLQGTDR